MIKRYFLQILIVLLLLAIAGVLLSIRGERPKLNAEENKAIQASIYQTAGDKSANIVKPEFFPIRNWLINEPEISAKAAIIISFKAAEEKNNILYQKNINQVLPIASLSKIMTAVVVLENFNPDEVIKVSKNSVTMTGDKGGLIRDEELMVKDLLYIMLMESSNDAATALAGDNPRMDYNEFINQMNSKARELNLKNTFFSDAVGLSAENQSTVSELAILTRYVFNFPLILEILKTANTTIYSLDNQFVHNLTTTNKLLGKIPQIIGGKTGFTEEAGGCMLTISSIPKDNYLITVILGSAERENGHGKFNQMGPRSLYLAMNVFPIIKILTISALSFVVAVFTTPILTHFLYKYRLGKKIRNEGTTPVYTSLHKSKEGTPTMGGILIWVAVAILAVGILLLAKLLGPDTIFSDYNFLTRKQTLLPLGILLFAAVIGLIDDLLGIFHFGRGGRGLRLRERLFIFTIISIVGAYWFYFKLDWDLIHIPFVGDFNIGFWYIPIFIFIVVATAFSTNQTDGLDGLAGGVLLTAFSAYAVISYAQGRLELAVFCGAIVGALLSFLWFNIHPARFFMGDTGSMSLGITLGVIAMLTNSLFFLPFIGFILVIESASTLIQVLSKKIRHKKIFLSAPIHHHFEAKGWPETKVTMRFWIVSGVMAVIGLILFFIDANLF